MPLPEKKQWYVIYTKPQKEEFAQFHLKLKNLEPFFPRLLLPVFSRRQKRVVPLFPNYLFVRIDFEKEYDYVRWSPGVKCFVSFNDTPIPLEEGVADYLIRRANSDGIICARSDLIVGQEVRICGGAFDGVLGMIERTPDAKGRVKILMTLLSRQVSIEVPLGFVDSGWVINNQSPLPVSDLKREATIPTLR
jgi:transcription antitermination factor NusG